MPTRIILGYVVQEYSDDGKLLSQSFQVDKTIKDPITWEDEGFHIIDEPPGMECEDVELVPHIIGYLGTIPANPTAPMCESLSFKYGVCQSLDFKNFFVTLRFPYTNEAQERYFAKLDDWEAVRVLMLNGKKIEAIKKLRTHTNMGLKESKSVVEVMNAIDSTIQRAVNTLKFPVPEDKAPVKEIGLCHKCLHRIEKPGSDFVTRGGEKIQCTEIIGCKLTKFFQNGDNCPLIEK
jgi:hypothetical protein